MDEMEWQLNAKLIHLEKQVSKDYFRDLKHPGQESNMQLHKEFKIIGNKTQITKQIVK